ncbi:MAG: hypothetical protein LAT77_00615 [Aliidiomarina sp.]|uniref:hypothetical protein n=1 Tax=Aliidiomarina sp. TaxID=1872439 RepID=UPI0025BCAEBF|nr:hypothetical protein [Aliidiomarina sp.]MCH8500393.1 hypothetical protein [Aliidiomarina sp.]
MQKWKCLYGLLFIALLSGCASRLPDNAAQMDREQAIAELSARIDRVGYQRVRISPGIDEFLNIAAAILEQQAALMSEYRTQAEFHRDVQAFLTAYQGAEPEVFRQAVADFDSMATTEQEKIGPKLTAYERSTRIIQQRNRQLAVEISAQLLVGGYLLKEHREAVVAFALANVLGGLTGGHGRRTADNDLVLAILRARDQLQLARRANTLIQIEQATIAAIDSLQRDLEALNQR